MDKEKFVLNNINNIKSIRIIINDNYCEEGDLETIIIFNDDTKKSLFVSWDRNGDYSLLSDENNEEEWDEEFKITDTYEGACWDFKDKKISFEEMKEAIKTYCRSMIDFINKKEQENEI